jgi:FkbM family methyltransferase
LIEQLAKIPIEITTTRGILKMVGHGHGSYRRAKTLLTKEPHTLAWIDSMPAGSRFWDIGANVGTFSLYAAQRKDMNIFAFEPSAVNFHLLTANVQLNEFSVLCFPFGFSDRTMISSLECDAFCAGGAFSYTGKRGAARSHQTALTWRIDDFARTFELPPPHYVKIDVHGLTASIVAGAEDTLRSVTEVQIETKETGKGATIVALLESAGLKIARRYARENGKVGDILFRRQ